VNLLEATRQHSPEAVFVFLSTNKVYGEAPPNEIPLKELEKRFDYAHAEDFAGITENCRIDRTMRSCARRWPKSIAAQRARSKGS
jgi:CDP-paratose 2-epimerase